jgi:hypothetical protein
MLSQDIRLSGLSRHKPKRAAKQRINTAKTAINAALKARKKVSLELV